MTTDFDRLRPRHVLADPASLLDQADANHDVEGKRALFSLRESKPARGSVTGDGAQCGRLSVLSPARAGRLLLTTVHAPGLRRHHVSRMRCPSCGRRSWCRLRVCL